MTDPTPQSDDLATRAAAAGALIARLTASGQRLDLAITPLEATTMISALQHWHDTQTSVSPQARAPCGPLVDRLINLLQYAAGGAEGTELAQLLHMGWDSQANLEGGHASIQPEE